mmetsp:Transcript_1983/g.3564  ORF Transcript_1983/g.3564 Transcript_1983/m.3564 type:complete len:246 (+) Transcript_1983:334-1071(+)
MNNGINFQGQRFELQIVHAQEWFRKISGNGHEPRFQNVFSFCDGLASRIVVVLQGIHELMLLQRFQETFLRAFVGFGSRQGNDSHTRLQEFGQNVNAQVSRGPRQKDDAWMKQGIAFQSKPCHGISLAGRKGINRRIQSVGFRLQVNHNLFLTGFALCDNFGHVSNGGTLHDTDNAQPITGRLAKLVIDKDNQFGSQQRVSSHFKKGIQGRQFFRRHVQQCTPNVQNGFFSLILWAQSLCGCGCG